MIEYVRSYKSSDGTLHFDLEEVKKHEIAALLGERLSKADGSEAASLLCANADKVIEILSLKESSIPAARKSAKDFKPRKKRTVAAQFALPNVPAPPSTPNEPIEAAK